MAAWTVLLIVTVGMVRYHIDYFDSRQKRTYDVAARYLDGTYQPGDGIAVATSIPRGLLTRYLNKPFSILPLGGTAIKTYLQDGRGQTVWIVDIQEQPGEIEKNLVDPNSEFERGRTGIYDMQDTGLTLRMTPYRLGPPPGSPRP